MIQEGSWIPLECQAFSALLGKYARHADNRGPSYLGALHALRSSHTSCPFTSMPGIQLHILVHYGQYAYWCTLLTGQVYILAVYPSKYA